ncbi:MAG: LysR family transcriptional regulator [Brasilonema angustatum HA4187-MV1]|jgi:DNA-binding transcriptional LysR family regulator|nr:LysR family transcriptional regulator [Brasilonema angustatum HA4187-MV1]
MDLQQLRYFQAVARLEHMRKAAEELSIAQPALSKAIARLEKELGVPLFNRVGRHIQLNQFGRAYLHRVQRIFDELEKGQREIDDMAGPEQGQIGLAVLHTIGAQLLPELISVYRRKHPAVKFRLFQNGSLTMLNQLTRSDIDLCITSFLPKHEGIGWISLMTEEIFLAVPPGHHLAGLADVCLSEVAQEDFVSLKSGYSLREQIDQLCRQAGFEPTVTFEGDELTIVRGLVAKGLGVGLIPALAWRCIDELIPVKLRITNPLCQRTIGVAWREEHYLSSAARLFRQFLIDYFAQLEQEQASDGC